MVAINRADLQRLMRAEMETHPFWRKVVGTPAENDLPIRAANVAWELLSDEDPYDLTQIVAQSGISQRELAKRLGVTEARVSQMLSESSNVTVATIRKVRTALASPVPNSEER